MKRWLVLTLSLVMILSLVACGVSTTEQDVSDTVGNVAGTDNSHEILTPESSQETATPSATTSTNDSSMDTAPENLIINEDVKPENFKLSDSGEDYETYTLENIPYREVLDYKNILIEKGFCITSYSMGSDIEADRIDYEIKYKFQYSGTESIISFTELERRAEQGLEDPGVLTVTVRVRDLSQYNLPELPEGDWCIDDGIKRGEYGWVMHRLNSYVNCTKAERVALAKSYVESLKENGYTVNAEEYPEGKELDYTSSYVPLYNYYAEDENGRTVEVYVYEDLAFPYTQAGVDEWAGVEITFKSAEEEEKAKADSVLPELPEGEWDKNEYSNGEERVVEYSLYLNEGNAVEQAMPLAADYVETLKKSGYNLEIEEYPEGNEAITSDRQKSIYYFVAKDANGAWVCVNVYVIPYTVETPAPPPAKIFISLHNPK